VHKTIGRELAEAKIEKVVLMRNSVTPFIEQGLKEAGYSGEIIWFNDALVAFKSLPTLTLEGDVVLIQNDWPDQYF
jgi:UDP-N-acetylmuramyl pentapeptide synthase